MLTFKQFLNLNEDDQTAARRQQLMSQKQVLSNQEMQIQKNLADLKRKQMVIQQQSDQLDKQEAQQAKTQTPQATPTPTPGMQQ